MATNWMVAVNRGRREAGELWQGRFFDHALRTVKDYLESVEYIHLNPVRRSLVKQPEQWRWPSYREYAGLDGAEQERQCGLKIDPAARDCLPTRVQGFEAKSRRPPEQVCATLLLKRTRHGRNIAAMITAE